MWILCACYFYVCIIWLYFFKGLENDFLHIKWGAVKGIRLSYFVKVYHEEIVTSHPHHLPVLVLRFFVNSEEG